MDIVSIERTNDRHSMEALKGACPLHPNLSHHCSTIWIEPNCVALSAVAIIVPFVAGLNLGSKIDTYLKYLVPIVAPAFAVLAFIRCERVVWPIIGIVLAAFNVGLHLI